MCHAEAPHLEKEYWQKLRDQGLVVIGINTAEAGKPEEKARAFQQKHGLTYPILLDERGKIGQAYRSQILPTNVIIDREGKLRYIDANFQTEAITRTLRELMKP